MSDPLDDEDARMRDVEALETLALEEVGPEPVATADEALDESVPISETIESANVGVEADVERARLGVQDAPEGSFQQTTERPFQPQRRERIKMPDSDWGNWASAKVNEIDDATWLVDPKGAVERVLGNAGAELVRHGRNIAYTDAMAHTTAAQLDQEFTRLHPDLMRSEVERAAVAIAVGKVAGDARFQRGIRDPAMREKMLGVVAVLANHELGRAAPGAQRPADSAGKQLLPTDDRRQSAAMWEVVDYARGNNKFGGGL